MSSAAAADDLPECPLCMEVLELDDMNFFPCTCGYQICRFCWHRIRTDENGLCPACRKSYPEDPAQFKPLTDDEVHKIKKDRRQKEAQRKQKSAENRKHLANVRVVQKNLVFVVGLAPRLTDPEVLKRHEYFGRFGKIHKVVINQSTSYVGSQGPSASAYVTYIRPEDALNAIRFVNNAQVDGRTIKASLGTTKYCSHFLKGTQCMKTDCMYLHDLGDEAASFTKEEIQQGKHVQYEQKLSEQYLLASHASNNGSETTLKAQTKPKESSPTNSGQLSPAIISSLESNSLCSSELLAQNTRQPAQATPPPPPLANGVKTANGSPSTLATSSSSPAPPPELGSSLPQNSGQPAGLGSLPPPFVISASNHLSLFSDNGFLSNRSFKPDFEALTSTTQGQGDHLPPAPVIGSDVREMTMARNASDVQEVVFGGNSTPGYTDAQDDDLGFDPYVVSAEGLADMIEKEKANHSIPPSHMVPPSHLSNAALSRFTNNPHLLTHALRSKLLPPGFAPPPAAAAAPLHPPNGFIQHPANSNHIMSPHSSKMLSLMHLSAGVAAAPPSPLPPPPPSHISRHPMYGSDRLVFGPASVGKHGAGAFCHHLQSSLSSHQPPSSMFNMQEWQEGFKALLPNINISFGTQSLPSHREFGSLDVPTGPSPLDQRPILPMHSVPNYPNMSNKGWCSSSSLASHSLPDLSWDPAIINTGAVTDSGLVEEPPHWMASIHHLTDDHHSSGGQMQMHPSHSMSWLQQPSSSVTRFPPPGFANSSSVSRQLSEKQKMSEQKLPAS